MRKLIYSMGVSLDGFIAGPDGEIDWTEPDA
jgi:dihydrofolate reductase